MAVQITVEFTDAQWELIQAHLPHWEYTEGGQRFHKAITEEELSVWLLASIKAEVEVCIKRTNIAAVTLATEDCFDV